MDRLAHLQNKTFDLIIIGGGIIGSGIARDAALRGLDTVLFEKGDYCCGTTARSTRLIHGGLRYLETMDFRLVRMDLREREILLRIAGHLVKPVPFIVPFYDRSRAYRSKVMLGMMLYDLLGFDKSLPSHRRLKHSDIVSLEPRLEQHGLQGGFLYYDAQAASPERLVTENLLDAREHGAEAFNYCEVIGAIRKGVSVQGVRVRDLTGMSESAVNGRLVINAGGPWCDQVSGRMGIPSEPKVRMTKGIHIICQPLSTHALVLFSRFDGRLFFIVPWLGQSLVGTTDTDFVGDPGEARSRTDDIEYLLESIHAFVPSLEHSNIRYSYAGVRALVPEHGVPSSVSRLHRIVDEAGNGSPGLLSVVGGKITGYRAIAEEAVDAACARLGIRRECRTATTPLPGGGPEKPALFMDKGTARHLLALYGSRASDVMNIAEAHPKLMSRLAPGYPDIAAQVVYSMRKEQCMRATDFLLRRSLIGFTPDQGCGALPAVIDLMAEELNWSEERKKEEFDEHANWIQRTRGLDTD